MYDAVVTLPIHEDYQDYAPPKWVRPCVERLIGSLAPEHIADLESIVLTNAARIPKGKTRRHRGRKFSRKECLGFYHPASRGGRAWIQILVDRVLHWGRVIAPFSLMRDLVVGHTLYHEVGHHLHDTLGSAARGGEESADDWSRRLMDIHFQKRYWYARPLAMLLQWPVTFVANALRQRRRGNARDRTSGEGHRTA